MPILVFISLIGIGRVWTIIRIITNPIHVTVLPPSRIIRAAVTDITMPVAVGIGLISIGCVWTVIKVIQHPVAIAVSQRSYNLDIIKGKTV